MAKKLAQTIIYIIGIISAVLGLRPLLDLPPNIFIGVVVAAVGLITLVLIFYLKDYIVTKNITLKKVERFSNNYQHLIFAYGSLLLRDSLLRTIKKEVTELECIPATLQGYKINWGAFSKRSNLIVKDKKVDSSMLWGSLVAEESTPGDRVRGAIVGVSNEGLLALRNRERHYIQKDITSSIKLLNDNDNLPNQRIYTFLPHQILQQQNLQDQNFLIRKQYFKGVSSSLQLLGHKKLELPKQARLVKAFLVEEKMERIFRNNAGEKFLKNIYMNVEKDLTIAEETRSIAFTPKPLCVTRQQYEHIATVAETVLKLSTKSLKLIANNSHLAEFCDYSSEDITFLKHSINENDTLPQIARVDLVMSGNRLLVFEINADSPGGMHHSDIISNKQAASLWNDKRFRWIECRPAKTSDKVIDAFHESLQRSTANQTQKKRAGIIEYRPKDWPTYPEMQYFEKTMKDQGITAEIIDLYETDLTYNEHLFAGNKSGPYDLIYKRAVWNDLVKSPESLKALSSAYINNKVCVVNSLGSLMAGNKMLLSLVKSDLFQELLQSIGEDFTAEEQKIIHENLPYSKMWGDLPEELNWKQDSTLKGEILSEPWRYVLKSFHGLGGKEVIIGGHQERPVATFESLWNKKYIVQEYIPHGRVLTPVCNSSNAIKWEYHYYILGAYVINGKCSAIEVKTSAKLPINMSSGAYRTSLFSTKA